MGELRETVKGLAAALGRLDDSTHLLISRVGSDRFVDEAGSNRFVQFARSGALLRAESVGDRYLSGYDGLTEGQLSALTELGWQDPDGSGNYWRHWDAPLPLEEAAAFAIDTLERVHGATQVEQLRFDAAPLVLAALSEDDVVSDPRVIRLGYWDYDAGQALTCPSCAWTGTAGGHHEQHRDVIDVRCPSCDQLLLVAVFPTLEETRAAATAGNPRAVAGLPDIEEQARAAELAYSSLLKDPSQLPELTGDELVIDWDVEGQEPDLDQVLRHHGFELWRESAFYESYRRFEEVFAILQTRYGSRFAGLVPTKPSELWLYGDRLSSPAIVESLNRSVSRTTASPGGVLDGLAGMFGAEPRDVVHVLPSPIEEVDIQHTDGTLWLRCGDPVLVLVGVRDNEIVVAEPGVEWLGHIPALRVRAERAVLSGTSRPTIGDLADAASAVKEARLRRFQECVDCGESTPPEWMTSGRLCHGCAQSNHGVVFSGPSDDLGIDRHASESRERKDHRLKEGNVAMAEQEHPDDEHLVAVVRCSVCGETAARVEVVPPGNMPVGAPEWPRELLELFLSRRTPGSWRFIYSGVVAGNGRLGDDESPSTAATYREAFREPISFERVRQAGLYDYAGFCTECEAPYCASHWNLDAASWGHCPNGHTRSHDPHWSPDDYD